MKVELHFFNEFFLFLKTKNKKTFPAGQLLEADALIPLNLAQSGTSILLAGKKE